MTAKNRTHPKTLSTAALKKTYLRETGKMPRSNLTRKTMIHQILESRDANAKAVAVTQKTSKKNSAAKAPAPKAMTEEKSAAKAPAPKAMTEEKSAAKAPAPKAMTEEKSAAKTPAPKAMTEEKSAAKTPAPKNDTSRDPRLPAVGTMLTRKFKGKTVSVKILDDGFLHNQKTYSSLSAVAIAIAGFNYNGFRFWGIDPAVWSEKKKREMGLIGK
jgi:hypothetical protein